MKKLTDGKPVETKLMKRKIDPYDLQRKCVAKLLVHCRGITKIVDNLVRYRSGNADFNPNDYYKHEIYQAVNSLRLLTDLCKDVPYIINITEKMKGGKGNGKEILHLEQSYG